MGQIGESFETIGKDITRETIQAPKDMVGAALESVGLSSGKKNPKKQTTSAKAAPPEVRQVSPAVTENDEAVKRAVARAALEELSGRKPQQKEPTIWEKMQKEEEEKKELEKKKKAEAAKQTIAQPSSRKARGDLYGIKAKKAAAEIKGKRQD